MSAMQMRALGEVASFVRGITFKPTDVVTHGEPGSITCFRTKNVQEEIDLSDLWAVPESFAKRSDQRLAEGDILVSTANSWNLVGKCSWVPKLEWEATLGGFISAIRSDRSKVDPRYLYRWFSAPQVQAQVRSCARQTTNIANLSIDRCLALQLPVPFLPEQRRIAAILDQADALRRLRRESLAELGKIPPAALYHAFPNAPAAPLVNARKKVPEAPNGARWVKLTNVARLATGHTPDRKIAKYWDGDIPWLSLTDIRALDGLVATETSQHVTQAGIDNSSSVLLPAGTVCLARTASVGFATIMGQEMATSQDFVNWVCGPELDPVYLLYALLASRSELRSLAPGSTHKTIYFPTVKSFQVLLPSIDVQRQCAESIRQYWEAKKKMEADLAVRDSLFACLQHRAFRGEL